MWSCSKYVKLLHQIVDLLFKIGTECNPGWDNECASGRCVNNECVSKRVVIPQAEVGDTCWHSKECKSRKCNNDKLKRGVCIDHYIANNEICLRDDECMHGKCASVEEESGKYKKKCGIEVSTCKLI